MVSQAFFLSLPREVQNHIKETGKVRIETMIEIAQNYSDAHSELESTQQYHKKKEISDFRRKNDQRRGLKESKLFGKTSNSYSTKGTGDLQGAATAAFRRWKRSQIQPCFMTTICLSTTALRRLKRCPLQPLLATTVRPATRAIPRTERFRLPA